MNNVNISNQDRETILRDRYKIEQILGQGGMGIAYSAMDLRNNQLVAIKKMSLRQTQEWKTLELFEREAQILKQLNHPQIPKYLDYFEIDRESDREFYLVRELIEGFSLAEAPQQFNQTEVVSITRQILDILIYLHSFNPPIIHRDIKPENIILQANGLVCLVDFGAIQNVLRNADSFASTFVGTLGYMPPEQFRGVVCPASDLYSLGCTLLFLLTKKAPIKLPVSRLKIKVVKILEHYNLSPLLVECIDKLLEPCVEDRFKSAYQTKKFLSNGNYQTVEKKALEAFPSEKFDYLNNVAKNTKDFSKCQAINHRGNTIFLNGKDTFDFHPEYLTIHKDRFSLILRARDTRDIRYPVRGFLSEMNVLLIREVAKRENSLYCCIFDGVSYHKFGTGLSHQERVLAVNNLKKIINYYLKKSSTNLLNTYIKSV